MARVIHSPDTDIAELAAGDILVCRHVADLADSWRALQSVLALLTERSARLTVRNSSKKSGERFEVWAKHDLKRAASDRAHARGAYVTGRPIKADPELARELSAVNVPAEVIAALLGVCTRTVARYIERASA